MDSALPFLQTHTSFFRLDDIWVGSKIKYSAKMGLLRVDLLACAKKPCQTSSDAPPEVGVVINVWPESSLDSVSALLLSSSFTTASRPVSAARESGVWPELSLDSMSAFLSSRS